MLYNKLVLRILIILPFLILLANLAFLDYSYLNANKQREQLSLDKTDLLEKVMVLEDRLDRMNLSNYIVATPAGQTSVANSDSCPLSCAALINTSISAIKSTPSTTTKPATTVTQVNQKGEYYIPLGSGQVTQLNIWVTIDSAQATLDTTNFPKIKQAYFEAILRTDSGEVKARLYDVSTPYIYAGNEARTDSFTGKLISVPINLQPGSKSYKVQLYSTISTGVLDSARIKLVTQ